MHDPIYLDYNATTPLAPEVLEAMIPALRENWGNPSSAHAYGQRAKQALDLGRQQVAMLLGCEPEEIVFTSGGTESDNAAIVGAAEALQSRGRHVITSSIEHPAVDRACNYLESRGWHVTRVGVNASGQVEVERLEAAVRPDTVLISLMHANNETGVMQPLRELAASARRRGIVTHTDAAQSVGKLPTGVDQLGVDLLTVAGHKLYAPKGVGALYIRRGTPFAGFMRGAGQEAGQRSGTEDVPQIVGLGAACELARRELPRRAAHLQDMRDRLERNLRRFIPDLLVHGGSVERLPNTLSAAIPRVQAQRLLPRLQRVATSAGAACYSGKARPSSVLLAMGLAQELALCTLRLTVGRSTSPEEVDAAAEEIGKIACELREG